MIERGGSHTKTPPFYRSYHDRKHSYYHLRVGRPVTIEYTYGVNLSDLDGDTNPISDMSSDLVNLNRFKTLVIDKFNVWR